MRESDPSREGSLFFAAGVGFFVRYRPRIQPVIVADQYEPWHSYANGMMQPAFEQYCNWLESVR
ncbi:MAG: hypothetical protein ABT23_07430 [Thiobacillus sp. SCN 63-57]|nr:MAG: hypothetical protein ABT23_07430 [Thiobacillus sp. SCN 63-57]